MARNISFSMTTRQFINQTKTVTRRFGWAFLKPGDIVCGVKKSMGLKKGEPIERLGMIRIVSTRWEPLNAITPNDVKLEGFPDWNPQQFIDMLVRHYRISPDKLVNRIEFEYCEPKNDAQLELNLELTDLPPHETRRSAY